MKNECVIELYQILVYIGIVKNKLINKATKKVTEQTLKNIKRKNKKLVTNLIIVEIPLIKKFILIKAAILKKTQLNKKTIRKKKSLVKSYISLNLNPKAIF